MKTVQKNNTQSALETVSQEVLKKNFIFPQILKGQFEFLKKQAEDVFLSIKNYFTSSKYVIKGKCKQCGVCCSNILFSNENGYVKSENEFKKMQKKHLVYRFFYPNGKVTNEEKKLEGAILFKCRFLKNNKCKIYHLRPIFCRDYPSINKKFIEMGGTTLDNCGYYFAPDKSFKDYLK